jgi:hypothetical protein
MTVAANDSGGRPVVAVGPEMPGWGSWDWVGADSLQQLSKSFAVAPFRGPDVPDCDLVLLVKHPLPPANIAQAASRAAVLYCPVDCYGSATEIDADRGWLRRCSRVLVHCERLRRYFEPYAPVESLDHHVKFAAPMRARCRRAGPFLWVGVRSNLAPLVEWVNAHPLPGALRILTNPEEGRPVPSAAEVGIRPEHAVRIEAWSPGLQLQRTREARGALDIKGSDFRSRHKPPAKAIDFIASGVPLAMNPESSPVEHLARMGFEVASPLDTDRWLSSDYWEETRRFGLALRELLSLERVGRRLTRIVQEVLAERRRGATPASGTSLNGSFPAGSAAGFDPLVRGQP